jgi:hypothetical protein
LQKTVRELATAVNEQVDRSATAQCLAASHLAWAHAVLGFSLLPLSGSEQCQLMYMQSSTMLLH